MRTYINLGDEVMDLVTSRKGVVVSTKTFLGAYNHELGIVDSAGVLHEVDQERCVVVQEDIIKNRREGIEKRRRKEEADLAEAEQ